MKIYLVITPFFPTKDSFVGPYTYDQVKAIQNMGKYRVVVMKPGNSHQAEDYEYEGIQVYRFKSYAIPSGIFPGIFDFLSVRSFLNKLRRLHINPGDVAVVHSHVTGLGIYANAFKKINPNAITLLQHHGFDVLSLENGLFHRFQWHRNYVRKYGVSICNNIDIHIGISHKTLEYLTAYPEIYIKDSYVLYNGVDTKKFYPVSGLKDPSIFKIGCVANFWPLKDQITLIKAVEILIHQGQQNIRVEFIGSGVTYQDCVDYVTMHSLNPYIVFKNEVFHQELLNFYNALDLFVLPSYYEAFGCVYTEAYACGVPFIAVKEQGISELIADDEKEKWLIDRQDEKILAKLILDYKQNEYIQLLNKDIEINILINQFLTFLILNKNS